MRKKIQSCQETLKTPMIVAEEMGRKFCLSNTQKKLVKKIRIDGCVIDDKRERCDYLFEIEDPCQCAIYVELKGSDVAKAYSQLVSTMGYLKDEHKGVRKLCFIVCSRVPKGGPKVQNLKAQMAQKHRAVLRVDTTQSTVNLDKEF